ncbi:MAG: MarR family transcriptional regulator [Alphaproteobacteria bacterium]|nr:MarR family transcriptional regulator [Alphaproteobacteria bacterium]
MMEGMPKKQDDALADFLCFSVYSLNHAFNRVYRPLLDGLDLTYPQYLVMQLLWAQDGRSVKEIGKELRLESNTLTPLLKRLQATGLIDRRRGKSDERVVRIFLTGSGEALHARAADVQSCLAAAIGLDTGELSRLSQVLDDLRDRLIGEAEKLTTDA